MNNSGQFLFNLPVKTIDALVGSLRYIRQAKLWLQVVVAMVLGIICGTLLSPDMGWVSKETSEIVGAWVGLPGSIFLALIQMIVVPLILSSIVQGIASAGNVDKLKTTGLAVVTFFVLTSALAVTLGITVGSIVRPGDYIDSALLLSNKAPIPSIPKTAAEKPLDFYETEPSETNLLETLPTKVSGILPKNPISSIVEGDMFQIVVFSIILGIGMLMLRRESARPLFDLTSSIQEVSMAIVGMAMSFAPLAVFALLTQSMIKTGPTVLSGLGIYTASVIGAMVILYVLYVAIAVIFSGISPIKFLKAAREPGLIAFSVNSSAATMPVTVKSAQENLNVDPALAQFIVPLGATINMGGTACYQGLSTLFMAQIFGLDLSTASLIALVVTAVGASIGTPAVPGVGIVVLSGVLASAGVPLEGIPLIVGLDRILERFRTALNVTGDLVACVIMDRFQAKKLRLDGNPPH